MKVRIILCRGAGLFHRPARPVIRALVSGQPLILIREPENPVDKNAVRVCDLFGKPLTYINRGSATWLAPKLDAGTIYLAYVHRVIAVPECDIYARLVKQPPQEIELSTYGEVREREDA